MTLLFIKRLNDTFEENAEKLIKEKEKEYKEKGQTQHTTIRENILMIGYVNSSLILTLQGSETQIWKVLTFLAMLLNIFWSSLQMRQRSQVATSLHLRKL